eukprot:6459800-Amphidinium_carterae.2
MKERLGSTQQRTGNQWANAPFRTKTAVLLDSARLRNRFIKYWQNRNCIKMDAQILDRLANQYAEASDWATSIGSDGNVAILYSCPHCQCAPLRNSGWSLAKTCGSGSYTKTQWHCPHCAKKWTWGSGSPERWIIIYKSSTEA